MSEFPKNSIDIQHSKRGSIAAVLALCGALAGAAGGCSEDMDKVCQEAGFKEASPQLNRNWKKLKEKIHDRGDDPSKLDCGLNGRQVICAWRKNFPIPYHSYTDDSWLGKCVKKDQEK